MAEGHVPTIRGRLLRLLLLPALLVLTAGIVIDYFVNIGPIEDSYDQSLVDAALSVAAHLSSDGQGATSLSLPADVISMLRADSHDAIYYGVAAGGAYIAGDRGLPEVAAQGGNPARGGGEFRGQPIRLVTYRLVRDGVPVAITIAETMHKRATTRARTLTRALAVDVAQLAIAFAILWYGSRWALRPLERVREEISHRSARTLEPIPLEPVPREIRRVIEELNHLFATVQESSQAQRRFLESAAHQLRTPLTGIQAQLELMVLDESSEARRDRLAKILEGARRLSHTTLQLLTLARSDEAAHLRWRLEPVPLDQLVAAIISDRLAAADAAGVDLGAQLQPVVIEGVSWLLREALGNLVNNAIAHTPAGGTVTVACGTDPEGAFLEVADSGVGIPADERRRVLERFYRASNALGLGSGLGLAIVNEVAQQHGATLVIRAGPQGSGTLARIMFGPRPSPAGQAAVFSAVPTASDRRQAQRRDCAP